MEKSYNFHSRPIFLNVYLFSSLWHGIRHYFILVLELCSALSFSLSLLLCGGFFSHNFNGISIIADSPCFKCLMTKLMEITDDRWSGENSSTTCESNEKQHFRKKDSEKVEKVLIRNFNFKCYYTESRKSELLRFNSFFH